MGARTCRLTASRTGKHDIIVSQEIDRWWGQPETCQVEYDLEYLALRITTPPSAPEYAYPIRRANNKPRIGISINRVDIPMPFGHYNPFTHEIFVHETVDSTGPFRWTPYSNRSRPTTFSYARVGPKFFNITARAWEALGSPPRVTLLVDPISATITVRPDPSGAHALSPKSTLDLRAKQASMVRATIASIHETMPEGIYDPISLGRFEGVFKLRGSR